MHSGTPTPGRLTDLTAGSSEDTSPNSKVDLFLFIFFFLSAGGRRLHGRCPVPGVARRADWRLLLRHPTPPPLWCSVGARRTVSDNEAFKALPGLRATQTRSATRGIACPVFAVLAGRANTFTESLARQRLEENGKETFLPGRSTYSFENAIISSGFANSRFEAFQNSETSCHPRMQYIPNQS